MRATIDQMVGALMSVDGIDAIKISKLGEVQWVVRIFKTETKKATVVYDKAGDTVWQALRNAVIAEDQAVDALAEMFAP